ncbi:unknown (plasmid) [Haloarcula marismortui ATCC 43049]|uniref:Uncharacterized protein n=1 Tax=Haloarcula marismortui (strain ATCC 43049 / DSM 3752 / JCM 8966 / VKM B-1809) TaxID=272569 RepID=Q5V648_HALMA|nr:hypothetical protein [Haloarcula marismortui]AAV45004.1 unknown [Haloarcula marismortui ATCC 43049]QCP89976.1 hypothetical protein E6P14_03595 [Haloarcula marismortui ATCC 43049]
MQLDTEIVSLAVLAAPLQNSGAGDMVLFLFNLLIAGIHIAGMWMVFGKFVIVVLTGVPVVIALIALWS